MGAQTNNKYDIFSWIEKVIYSCENMTQYRVSENLANNFTKLYDDSKLGNELSKILQTKLFKLLDKE